MFHIVRRVRGCQVGGGGGGDSLRTLQRDPTGPCLVLEESLHKGQFVAGGVKVCLHEFKAEYLACEAHTILV